MVASYQEGEAEMSEQRPGFEEPSSQPRGRWCGRKVRICVKEGADPALRLREEIGGPGHLPCRECAGNPAPPDPRKPRAQARLSAPSGLSRGRTPAFSGSQQVPRGRQRPPPAGFMHTPPRVSVRRQELGCSRGQSKYFPLCACWGSGGDFGDIAQPGG